MTSTPVEVGTLIAVILKAKNLPNKRHIGKQDPYCSIRLNNETRRIKAVKRGGQHPEWDEEVRFTIFEDVEDELARTATAVGADESPPPPPPKQDKKKIKGGKKMHVMCYADDPREPDLIGETVVDLTEVLTKGETDEWFTLTNKDKYCGEVYLELTFWSNERPPEKRTTPPASTFHPQYGGPGSFTPSAELPATLKHGGSNQNTPSPSRIPSNNGLDVALPPSLRPSSSLAKVNLYTAPYEQHNRYSDVDQLSTGVADLNVGSSSRRRESFPPVQPGPSEFGFTGEPLRHSGSFSTLSSSGSVSSVYGLGPLSSGSRLSQGHHRNSLSSLPEPFVQDDYSSGLPQPMPSHSERHPTQSPYQFQPTTSGFVQPPLPSQTPVPSHFGIPPPQSGFSAQRPPPSANNFQLPQTPLQQYPAPPQTPFQYPPYPPPPASAPPHQYLPSDVPLPPSSVPPGPHSGPLQQYTTHHETPSPPHQNQQGLSHAHAYQQMQPSFPTPPGSRPLPTPQHQPPRPEHQSSGFASPPPAPPSVGLGSGVPNAMPFQPPGPPPPRRTSLPPTPTKTPAIVYPPPPPPPLQNGVHQPPGFPPNPPPPPPHSQAHGSQSPQPYTPQQAQGYGSWATPPPPPPLPSASGFPGFPQTPPSNISTPPSHSQQSYYPSPPPGPSVQFPMAPEWNTPQQHQDMWHQ